MIRSFLLQILLVAFATTLLTAQSNEGTEFYLSFPANIEEGTPAERYIRLYITSRVATKVDIYALGQFKGSVTTVPNDMVTFDLSKIEAQLIVREATTPIPDDQLYRGMAVRVVAEDPIVLYGMNRATYTSDGLLALPVSALGREYVVASSASNIPFGAEASFPSQFMVIAPHDNTMVTITFPMETKGHSAGETITVPMMKGDVYSAMSVEEEGDLTGAVIRADKPVAVTAGQNCTFLPDENYPACDHLVEMLTPTETWRRSYYALPIAGRTKGDTYRIIAGEEEADIFVNGVMLTTIDQVGGKVGFGWTAFSETERRPLLITSNKRISVAQYNNSQSYDNSTSTDPFYMLLSPVDQYVSAATITTPSSDFTENYINIVGDSTGMVSMEITTAGEDMWIPIWTMPGVIMAPMPPLDGEPYAGLTAPIPPGTYELRSDGAFSVNIYGGGNFDSYGYPAVLALQKERVIIIDAQPPLVTARMACDGTVVGEIVDSLSDENPGSGIVEVTLDPLQSENTSLTLDGSLESRPRRIGFRVFVTDAGQPARAVILTRDDSDNERRDTIDLSPLSLSHNVDPLDFGTIDFTTTVTRTASLLNTGTRGTRIVSAGFAGGTGFRIATTFTPTTLDAGDRLEITVNFTHDVEGTYHDTLLLTDSCGVQWRLPVVAVVDAGIGGVGSTGAALRGMRLTIAPNVIDGAAVAVTYALPTGRAGTISLVDSDGRTVTSAAAASTGGIDRRTAIDVSSLPAGRYWIVLRIDEGEIVEEITVVR